MIRDEVIDAICAGVKREPLDRPDAHKNDHLGFPYACSVGENPDAPAARSQACPGCAVHGAVRLVDHPEMRVRDFTNGKAGEMRPLLDVFRENRDDFHPLRVLVERELTRRASAPWYPKQKEKQRGGRC